MKNKRIFLSPPHMGVKERKYLTNACPEFTGYIEGLSIPIGLPHWGRKFGS